MKTYNPDVLLCLANLSNDEVFTPPQLANEVLDLLPKEIWKDKTIKFLDPCCKTGVFLREITIRLIEGLKDEIPDLQERVNHILTNQVFGIAITELTALTSRRTLYCSKDAHGEFSICTTFEHPEGNIYYRRVEHDWKSGKCACCGANQSEYDRSVELESYAYAFIHKPIEELFNMKFDVIIGNPPYQLSLPGDTNRALSIYHKFVEKALSLNPKYISMIIPAKWLSQKSMTNFKYSLCGNGNISHFFDFIDAKECFPSIQLEGGVCYFLWQNSPVASFEYVNIYRGSATALTRNSNEFKSDIFIRDTISASIAEKAKSFNEEPFSDTMSGTKPFGLSTNYPAAQFQDANNNIKLYVNQKRGGLNFINANAVSKNKDLLNKYKVLVSKGYGSKGVPNQVINKPILAEPDSCCTETYVIAKVCDSLEESLNVISYINTKFFRFLVSLNKPTQDALKGVYSLVPLQDFSKPWTDAELYEKYGLTQEEIDYIESMIRPMCSSALEEE